MGCTFAAGMLICLAAAKEGAAPAIELFNGKDLSGWVAEGVAEYQDSGIKRPVWSVEDGLLHCAGKGYGFLRYDGRRFADFALHVEYRMAPHCNSGIGIRTIPFDAARSMETRPSRAGYEIQLLDDAGQGPSIHGSGSLYRYVAPRINAVKAAPAWNVVDVDCTGPRIRVRINGQEVLDVDQTSVQAIRGKPLHGYVCLQNHGGRIDFRNIRIQEKQSPADH